ncbi:MAG TPA: hypothetical protein VMX13_16745 [Sedimentisphaerales bacterium]|nr:hypothetical protein [Sedimentisphaerales bacterium]
MIRKRHKIDHYCAVMEQIKKRVEVVNGFLHGGCYTLYMATTLECMYLQVRKILELIVLGSLVVNKKEFSTHHKNFHKLWNGGEILKKIEKNNPDFYPKPVKEKPSSKPRVKSHLEDIQDGYLTKDEFIEVYGRCGKIAHADNPFGSKTNYPYYEKQISEWLRKIMTLLNTHTIRLVNDQNMYLIHMKEQGDDKVHGYTFARV